MQIKMTVTATGDTEEIIIGHDNLLTFGALGDQDDYTATALVKITDDGEWFAAQEIEDGTLYSTVSGARRLKFNVSALGTATEITFEASGYQA